MRVLLILFWVFSIFILTCTSSFSALIESGQVQFNWDFHPQFAQLLEPMPRDFEMDFLVQKAGHITAFLILAFLLQTQFRSNIAVFMVAGFYAIATEFLQLYFTRDGRLFDIGFDAAGILFSLAIGNLLKTKQDKQISG